VLHDVEETAVVALHDALHDVEKNWPLLGFGGSAGLACLPRTALGCPASPPLGLLLLPAPMPSVGLHNVEKAVALHDGKKNCPVLTAGTMKRTVWTARTM
jgi:hypothetical protein